eukprot:TRINITY_DN4091_c0_g1_i2.p1 TRINITY_DN4091_c0_g1~~TRINITY_DN4091_c0_g1_i2.p1  ORF type:complete len:452 (-),score=71.54 TRINITY_DN4091_c0_g1_i2:287-1642(-)
MTNRLLQQFNGLYIHSAPRISTQSPSALTIDQQSASFAQSIREIHRRTDFQEIQSMPINDHISQLRQRLSALNDENPNGGSRWMVSWKGHKPNDATPQEPILYSRVETLLCQSYEAEVIDISEHHLNHPDHQPATDMNDHSDSTEYFTPIADSNQDQQVVQMEEPQSRDTYPDEGVTETQSVETASHTCRLITVEIAFGLEPFLESQDSMGQIFGIHSLHSVIRSGYFLSNYLLHSLLQLLIYTQHENVANALKCLFADFLVTHPSDECLRRQQYVSEKRTYITGRVRNRGRNDQINNRVSPAETTLIDIFISLISEVESGSRTCNQFPVSLFRELILGNNDDQDPTNRSEVIRLIYIAHGKDKIFGLVKMMLSTHQMLPRIQQHELAEIFCHFLPEAKSWAEEAVNLTRHTIARLSAEQQRILMVDVKYWASTNIHSRDLLQKILALFQI